MNLLKETLTNITDSGHTVEEVLFIGSADGAYSCTWAEFEALADLEYDQGYGAQEVATDLIMVFTDGKKMWRHEYDGSEWWMYDAPGEVDYTVQGKPITKLTGDMWAELARLNPTPEKGA
jgi:hypothetical protein